MIDYNGLKKNILNQTGVVWTAEYIRNLANDMLGGAIFDPSSYDEKAQEAMRIVVRALEDDYQGFDVEEDVVELQVLPPNMQMSAKRGAEIATTAVKQSAQKIIEHFIVEDGGCWRIDPENPPSLENSYAIAAEALGLNEAADLISSSSSWIMGNVISELRQLHGESFDMSLVCKELDKTYNTVITTEVVFNSYKGKVVPGASFSIHKEAHYTKGIKDKDKYKAIIAAAANELTVRQFKKVLSALKSGREDILDDDMELMKVAEGGVKVEAPEFILIKKTGKFLKRKGALTKRSIEAYDMILQTKPTNAIIKDTERYFG